MTFRLVSVIFLAQVAHADSDAFSNSVAYANMGMRYERFFNHYHDAAVYKIDIKFKDEDKVRTTLDQALDLIRMMHDFSGGIHQVVYLVGWNYNGHDSKYPAWDKVGDQCKSSFSEDSLLSLRAMMREARKYNCDVSFHINLNDAYTNSPLWNLYVERDLICRDEKGNLVAGGKWGGEQSYGVSHFKEWRSGFAQKRILGLLEMVPELKESHTIHIDACYGLESKYEGIGVRDDVGAINQIVDFWHEQGMDVTTEFLPSIDQIGYFPMMYHLNLDERLKTLYPPQLICGGAGWNTRNVQDYYNKDWRGMMPMPGCAYEEAWGIAHWGDLTALSLNAPGRFADRMFSTMLLYAYYNRSPVSCHTITPTHYRVERENGVVANVRMRDRALVVADHERVVVSDGDYFLDVPWGGGKILVHSTKGCDREFALPSACATVTRLVGSAYPGAKPCELPVRNGKVRVNLKPQESMVLVPAKD